MIPRSFMPWLMLMVTLLMIAINIVTVGRLFLEEDLMSLLPDNDPVIRDCKTIVRDFKMLGAMFFDITGRSAVAAGDSPPGDEVLESLRQNMIEMADRLNQALRDSGMFNEIYYQFNPNDMLTLFGQLSRHKASLLNPSELSGISEQLTAPEIEKRLDAAKRMLLEPSGAFLKDSITRDPLGLDDLLRGKLGFLSEEFSKGDVVDGRIWSRDARHILLVAIPNEGSSDSNKNKAIISLVDGILRRLHSEHPTLRISYTGGHRASLDNATIIKSDVLRSVTGSTLVIVVLGALFFRHKSYIFLVFLPMVFGITASMLLMSVFSPAVSAISLGCGVVLMGIVVDYGTHILYRLENDSAQHNARQVARSLALPLTMDAITIAGGLFCLTVSTFPGQQQMGAFGAMSVLFSALFAGLALPWLVEFVKPNSRGFRLSMTRYCQWLLSRRETYGVYLNLLTVALFIFALLGIRYLRFNGDPAKLNYLRAEHLEDQNLILDTWGEFSSTSVVVRGSTYQEALENNDKLAGLLAQLKSDQMIRLYSTISPVLPSQETQKTNRDNWSSFWVGSQGVRLRRELATTAAGLSFSDQAFRSFTDLVEKPSAEDIDLQLFEKTGFYKLLAGRIVRRGDDYIVMSTFSETPGSYEKTISFITEQIPDVAIMNGGKLVENITSQVRRQMFKITAIVCLVTTVCLWFFLKRMELVLGILLSVGFSLVLTLGILGWAGVDINLFSGLFVVFVFGAGIDYSIFLMSSYLDAYRGVDSHVADTFGAIAICILTTLSGFTLLTLAEHPALFSTGITGLTGMLSSLLAAFLVIPLIHRVLFPYGGRYGVFTFGKQFRVIPVLGLATIRALAYVLVLRPILRLRYPNQESKRARYARLYIRKTADLVVRFYLWSKLVKGQYLHADPQSFQKPSILVINHASSMDIVLILALPAEMVMVVKRWVWKLPVFGILIRDAGYPLVDGDDCDNLFKRSKQLLSEGVSIAIFPEGTRSLDGRMQRFRNGAFELARLTGADIIPVHIAGSREMMPPGSFWIGWSFPTIQVMNRITQVNYDYTNQARQFANDVRELFGQHAHALNRMAHSGDHFMNHIRDLYAYRGTMIEYYISGKLRLDPIYRHLDDYMPVEGTILDIGCGYGLTGNILSQKSGLRRIVGIDIDENKIRTANQSARYNDNLKFEIRDIAEQAPCQVDGILLIDMLHYWSEEKQKVLISKICRLLAKGGKLLFRDACKGDNWKHRLTWWLEVFSVKVGFNPEGDGLHYADMDFYLRQFQENGLILEEKLDHLGRGSNTALLFTK